MAAAGGSLFGSRMTWMRIIAIAVAFTTWIQISSCNEKADAEQEYKQAVANATSSGAIGYCTSLLRDREGDRKQFRVISSKATQRSEKTHYDVVINYSYLDTYRNATHAATYRCAAGYGSYLDGGWHTLRR